MFRYTKLTAAREVLIWIITIIGLLPFYFLIATAFKTDQEALTTSAIAPPQSLDFGSFISVLTATGRNSIPMAILNSAIITTGAIAGLVLFGSVAAYVITRRTRAWTNLTFYLVLIAIILPAQLGTVPLYIGARTVGLTGNALGMILLWIGILLPLSVFLYASFFRGLTTEYEEAAVIDGATPTQAFFRVVLPLMAPAVMMALFRIAIGMLSRPPVVSTSMKAPKSSDVVGATALVVNASWSDFRAVLIRK